MVVIQRCWYGISCFRTLACLIFTTVLVLPSSAQPGFISIDCGGSENFTSQTNLTWVTDSAYISAGQPAILPNFNNLSTVYQTVRYFPEDTPKSCYELPATVGMSYLIRTAFYYGNYDKKNTLPTFSLIVDGTILVDPVSADDAIYELYVPAMSTILSVCVARSLSAGSPALAGNPFITYLQLRPIGPGTSYDSVVLNNGYGLYGIYTVNLGSNGSSLRYPNDTIDRIWTSFASLNSTNLETTHEVVGGLGDTDYACPPMLQTATTDLIMPYPLKAVSSQNQYHVILFFAEIDPNVTASGQRVFDIYSNTHLEGTKPWASGIDIFNMTGGQYTGLRLASSSPVVPVNDTILISFKPSPNSTYGPIISGIQVLLYTDKPLSNITHDSDASTIRYVRDYYEIAESSGDPCMPSGYSWTWIVCTSPAASLTSNNARVTSIWLSKIPLKGSIVPQLNDFTELTELRLDDNQLNGAIPILGALQNLETLDLSNNKLTGGIPSWLADLPSLRELHLENNQLAGEVPSELLTLADRGTLNFTYGGNMKLTCNGQSCDSSSVPPPPPAQASPPPPPSPQGSSATSSYKASLFFILSIAYYCHRLYELDCMN